MKGNLMKNADTYRFNNILFVAGVIIFAAVFFLNCSKAGPPDSIIEKAKQRTVAIIDSVRSDTGMPESKPELVNEYYDKKENRYVLEYSVKDTFGSPLTGSPTAYIVKKQDGWYYDFIFGHSYKFKLSQQ
jgi:hypothetical protein